ncbi:hypothetical protein BC832DRAFT_538764 [Gaertneriomyces semiglobifer]|nr:hypothetical protein BC832DRAFT_538764 [Gaertneriomyces semiglobifer]
MSLLGWIIVTLFKAVLPFKRLSRGKRDKPNQFVIHVPQAAPVTVPIRRADGVAPQHEQGVYPPKYTREQTSNADAAYIGKALPLEENAGFGTTSFPLADFNGDLSQYNQRDVEAAQQRLRKWTKILVFIGTLFVGDIVFLDVLYLITRKLKVVDDPAAAAA